MIARTEITCTYEPRDFFEAPTTLELHLGELVIANAEVVYRIPGQLPGDARERRANAMKDIKAAFAARMVLTGRRYTLSEPGFVEIDLKERRHYTLFPEPVIMRMTASEVDLTIIGRDGAVKVDTRAERVASETGYVSALAIKLGKSDVLCAMAASYSRSIDDPANALVHLYELRDAAAQHFGGRTKAQVALGVTMAEWRRLGRLANDEPIREGRHRGKAALPLRFVKAEELAEARRIAKELLDAFATCV